MCNTMYSKMEDVLFTSTFLITNTVVFLYKFVATIVSDSKSVTNKKYIHLSNKPVLTTKMGFMNLEQGLRLHPHCQKYSMLQMPY